MSGAGPVLGPVAAALVLLCWLWIHRVPWYEPLGFVRTATAALAIAIVCVAAVGGYLYATTDSTIDRVAADATCKFRASLAVDALNNYRGVHGAFPPLIVYDDSGRPVHSWRSLVLPYLDSRVANNAAGPYDPNQPWDADANLTAARTAPIAYRCPAAQRGFQWGVDVHASYLRISDNDDPARDAFEWPVLIETGRRHVTWTRPGDISLNDALDLLTTGDDAKHDGADGSFIVGRRLARPLRIVVACTKYANFTQSSPIFVAPFESRQDAAEFLSNLDNVKIANSILSRQSQLEQVTQINWARLYAIVAFVAIAYMPAIALSRRRTREAERMAIA